MCNVNFCVECVEIEVTYSIVQERGSFSGFTDKIYRKINFKKKL